MSLPTVSPKGNYGPVLLEPIQKLFDSRSSFVVSLATGNRPKTFEHLSVNQGFVLYETNLPPSIFDPVILRAITKDRALVYVDGRLSGILSRIDNIHTIPLENPYGRRLSLLVENQGRLNFGNEIHDFKVLYEILKKCFYININILIFIFDIKDYINICSLRCFLGYIKCDY